MPQLTWSTKRLGDPAPGLLIKDSIVYPGGHGYPDSEPTGRLILGDNLAVMSALLPEYEGRIRLIYADPPFFTNRKYRARIGRGEDSRKPQDWMMVEGYHDAWPDLDAYLDFLYQRLALMYRLLAPTGTLYLHLDWHANSYARLLLDEIFGSQNLLNEIIWMYHGPSPIRSAFNRKHDTLLAYVKGDGYVFNADAVRQPYDPSTIHTFQASRKAGFGKVPDLARGKVPEDWWYFPVVARLHRERTGYPTQKPEALLDRIVRASSNADELVADFFCGSGTAATVAARLGRRFIACDNSFRAIHTTRTRLCALPSSPFTMERDSENSIPLSELIPPDVEITAETVKLDDRLSLDYWEIDPAWDGQIFKSAAQARRPAGTEELARELRIKTGRQMCVRFVTVEGEMLQKVLDV
jgi:DNA modification methylase